MTINSWASDVPIIKEGMQSSFKSFPSIFKEFSESKSKVVNQRHCQEWVSLTLERVPEDKVFEAFCAYKADVVLRKHVFTGTLILKAW